MISDNYQSENPSLEPSVTLVVNGGSLEFSVSYVIGYTKRTAMRDQMFTKIVKEVADSNGRFQWALSPTAPMSQTAAPDAIEARPSSSSQDAGKAAGSH